MTTFVVQVVAAIGVLADVRYYLSCATAAAACLLAAAAIVLARRRATARAAELAAHDEVGQWAASASPPRPLPRRNGSPGLTEPLLSRAVGRANGARDANGAATSHSGDVAQESEVGSFYVSEADLGLQRGLSGDAGDTQPS
jgi:hypothetical protein